MADAPWRCSECGTVNEPVANACRTCGRWPSLFDLEESKVDEFEAEPEVANQPATADFEPEVLEEEPAAEPAEPREPMPPRTRGRRGLARLIIPIAVIVYLVITNVLHR